jgi:beta-lactam-binding protein with PASTA domain
VTVVPPAKPPPYGPPGGFYEFDEPRRGRSFWPLLLALVLVAAAVVAGWYVYTKLQDQLNQNKDVAVPYVVGIKELNAVEKLRSAGLKPIVVRETPPDAQKDTPVTFVFKQDTPAGSRIAKGNPVTIHVSSGPKKIKVPSVIGEQSTDAVAAVTEKGLKADVHHVNSNEPAGTVTGQDPKAGTKLVEGEKVRINVSQGPKPIAVPPVLSVPYEQAAATLQGAGFAIARRDVDSNEPKGTVVQQDPPANSLAAKGSTISLYVSKGPKEFAVPDVTSFSRADAIATLRNSGFKVLVQSSDTFDPSQDGIVQTETPGPGSTAKPGTTVMIVVGHYVAPVTTAPTTTAPTTTDTTPIDTTAVTP